MSLITLLIYLVVIGLFLYAVGLLPIPQPIKIVITIVAILIVCIWLLSAVGGGPSLRIGR